MNINPLGQHLDRRVNAEPTGKTSEVGSSDQSGVSNPQDFFENSGQLGRVRALIDQLVQLADVRPDAVARGRSLLESGALDDPASVSAAADAILAGE